MFCCLPNILETKKNVNKIQPNSGHGATGPVLTPDKEKKNVMLPITLNVFVRRGKLRSYTLQKPPEVF